MLVETGTGSAISLIVMGVKDEMDNFPFFWLLLSLKW